MKRNSLKFTIATILLFLAMLLYLGIKWAIKNFDFTIEQLVFYLKVPLKGANIMVFFSFVKRCILPTTLFVAFIVIWLKNPFKWQCNFKMKGKSYQILPLKYNEKHYLFICIFLFIFSSYISFDKVGLFEYLSTQIATSTFIEENFVDPNDVLITFPEEKRNLVYIYVESLESTYFSSEMGGVQTENLMPNLTELSNQYINFSNNSFIGGAISVPGVTWTIGGMVAQTAGIPLKLPINGNAYGKFSSFLPGAYTLGDILEKEGYNQMFMMGSDAIFGGRDSYLKSHGNFMIYDYYKAIEKGKIASDYYVWWGYEDNKLFEYAKEEISNLASKEQPFNFSMLTVDTHFPDGYLSDECEKKFDKNLSNVVYCTDRKLGDFVNWLQEQDFYENTSIVIAGDHVSMDGNYFANVDKNYERTTFNLFINSKVSAIKEKNRLFSTMDLFPTTLASLGVEISGNKIALGTNLFSEEETLLEKYGKDYVISELSKQSPFFNKKILYGK